MAASASATAGRSRHLIPVLLCALVGGLIGAGLGFVNASGLLTPWTRLPTPPEAGVRIGSASSAYLILVSASGQSYWYSRSSARWETITDQQAAAYPNLALASPASGFMPLPPGSPYDVRYVLDPSQPGSVDYGAYALEQDGTVWAWFKTTGPTTLRATLLLPLGAAAAGLIVGLALVALLPLPRCGGRGPGG